MRTEYKGYKIELTVKQKDGLWAADVWVWTLVKTASPLSDWAGIEGHNTEDEAELAGLQWAKARVDIITEGRLRSQ